MGDNAVHVRSWVHASASDVRTGLLGYLTVAYHDLILDSVVLRRTADGRFALSFPARTDRGGRRHPFVRPADDEARKAIEREILSQLTEREDVVA